MLDARNLDKTFGDISILKGLNLQINQGQSCAIVGKSGIGKSTLLHILGSLEQADRGEVFVDRILLDSKNSDLVRRQKIGFIFQNYNVLEDFSVLENLKLAAQIRHLPFSKQECLDALEQVELASKASSLTKLLSGGEKQRLAIVRALMHKPKLILADEPTGSLDQQQSVLIENLLFEGVVAHQTTLVIVTHDRELAKKCDQILQLKDGLLTQL